MAIVYLVGDSEKENYYKIGVTRGKIENRIKKLQTGNAGDIFVVSTYETNFPFIMEMMLHNKYAESNIINEWFYLEKEEVDKFTSICDKIQENINALEDNYFFQKKYGKDIYTKD